MTRGNFSSELRDPALTQMLQDTFADDPALHEAPGRTERIMRAVLAHRERRRAFNFNWAVSLGWSCGAVVAAVLMVILILGGDPRQTISSLTTPTPVIHPTYEVAHEIPKAAPRRVSAAPAPLPEPVIAWKAPQPATSERNAVLHNVVTRTPAPKPTPAPATDAHTDTAAALFAAGNAAYAAGDFENAYDAYQASYETIPTPEAILGTGQVLQELASRELSTEG